MIAEDKIKNTFPYLIVILLAVISYISTFSGEFIFDDNYLIRDNSFISEPHSFYEYMSQEDGITDKKDSGHYHTGYYRPLINLTYRLDYRLWGMNATGFRTTNLILHILCCLLFYRLMYYFCGKDTAFWAAVIFCLHPVNTESVSFITSRNNIIASLFILGSLLSYISGWEKNRISTYGLSVALFAGAAFSKEFGLMVIPIIFLYQRLLSGRRDSLKIEIVSYIPFVAICVVYLLFRMNVVGSVLSPSNITDLWTRIYFIPYILIWNLRLFFLPCNLHFFNVPYPSNISNMFSIISIVLILLICLIIWFERRRKVVLFGVFSFLLTMFPVLGIIPFSSHSIVAMRWLYLPMMFLLLGLGEIIKYGLIIKRKIVTTLLIIAVTYLGTYTFILNKDHWHDEETLINQEILGFNNQVFGVDMAERYFREKNYDKAEEYYRIAIEKSPQLAYAYINFSALLIETERPNLAVFYLGKARDLVMAHDEQGEWHNNMGMALFNMGRKEEGLKYFQKAVACAPDKPSLWANLGGAYGMMGDYQSSIETLKKGINVSPDSIQLLTNLAMTYINMKDYQKAISALSNIPENERKGNREVLRLLKLAQEGLQNRGPELNIP